MMTAAPPTSAVKIARRFMPILFGCELLKSIESFQTSIIVILSESALVLDEGAHLLRRRKKQRCSVTRHSGRHNHRLAAERSRVARVRLEAEVGFPKIAALTVGRRDVIGVTAVPDRLDLVIEAEFLEVLKSGRSAHHAAARRRRLAGARALEKGDQVGAFPHVRNSWKGHMVVRNEAGG